MSAKYDHPTCYGNVTWAVCQKLVTSTYFVGWTANWPASPEHFADWSETIHCYSMDTVLVKIKHQQNDHDENNILNLSLVMAIKIKCKNIIWSVSCIFKSTGIIPGTTTESTRETKQRFVKVGHSHLSCDHLWAFGNGTYHLIYLLRSDLTEQNKVFIQMSGILFIIWYESMFILYIYEVKMTHWNNFFWFSTFSCLAVALYSMCDMARGGGWGTRTVWFTERG